MGNTENWYEERVEAYVDGELAGGELRMFEARLELDPDLRASVTSARELQSALGALPRYRCPPDMAAKVARITDTEPRRWPLRVAAAIAAAGLALGLSLGEWPGSSPEPHVAAVPEEIPADELAEAREELALALAYLDKAGAAAGREVGSQWIKPVERTLAAVEGSAG
ncbi:MAG: hypothetical protein R3200_12720 [Xanthomonadales bacterium]|nr:hypothetical protein [Xanthomonadales bacterium]